MKKALVLLLALSVIGFVFAQDDAAPVPVVSGSVQTGLWLSGTEAGLAGSTTLGMFHKGNVLGGWGSNVMTLAVNYDGKEGGLCVALSTMDFTKFTAATQSSDFMLVDYAYGYLNFGTIAKLSLGMLNDYTYATAWNFYLAKDGEGWETGALLDVTPVEGLNIGVYMPLKMEGGALPLPALNATTNPGANEADILVKYANSDLGLTIVAGYLMTQFMTDDTPTVFPLANQNDFQLGVVYKGIENLYLDLEIGYANIGSTNVTPYGTGASFSAAAKLTATEWVKYTMDAFGFGIVLNEYLYSQNSAFGFRVDPDVNYTMDAFKFGLTGRYVSTPNPVNTTVVNSMRVKPYVNITVGDFTMKPYIMYSDSDLAVTTANSTWAVGFDCAWSF